MTLIAVIPARGGSKRIPKKNIRKFDNVPVINFPISTCIDSGIFDEIVVTTDDYEIAEISKKLGATKVIMRSKELSDDFTPTVPVVADCIEKLNFSKVELESLTVACVYPVNPFIEIESLKLAIQKLIDNPKISYVGPICTYPYPIQRRISLSEGGKISMDNPELALTRSQDLDEKFHDAGQWYIARAETWLNQEPLLFNSIGIQVPRWRVQDIDTVEDWIYAEKLYKISKLN